MSPIWVIAMVTWRKSLLTTNISHSVYHLIWYLHFPPHTIGGSWQLSCCHYVETILTQIFLSIIHSWKNEWHVYLPWYYPPAHRPRCPHSRVLVVCASLSIAYIILENATLSGRSSLYLVQHDLINLILQSQPFMFTFVETIHSHRFRWKHMYAWDAAISTLADCLKLFLIYFHCLLSSIFTLMSVYNAQANLSTFCYIWPLLLIIYTVWLPNLPIQNFHL